MPTYIGLLRAVNVGGTGKVSMAELKAMCVGEGFTKVQTYIASGNVVFAAKQPASTVKALLEKRLHAYAGKPIGVIVRTADEMMSVLKSNPFSKAPPNRTVASWNLRKLGRDISGPRAPRVLAPRFAERR